MKEVYLDNSATTRAYDSVGKLVAHVMCEDYGNPSSLHRKGVEAEQYIKDAKETFARLLKVQEKEIYFTSGGTESNNWALIGTALANRRQGNHIIISSIEHPAVSAPAEFLESHGFVDKIVERRDMRKTLADLLRLHSGRTGGANE